MTGSAGFLLLLTELYLVGDDLADLRGSTGIDAADVLKVGLAANIGDLLKMDSVEFALCGADSAADAEIFIDDRAAAAETALRFLLDLLLGESAAQVFECLHCLLHIGAFRTLARGIVESVGRNRNGIHIELGVVSRITAVEKSLAFVYRAVY